MRLDDTHVLLTGGSRGIGAALARAFAGRGARVTLVARSAGAIDELARELGGTAVPADLLDASAVDDLVPEVERRVGPVDVLVNNAGMETTSAHAMLDPAVIRDTVRLNLEVPQLLTRAVLPAMVQRGRGHLVFVSSVAATSGMPFMASYCGTKAGLSHFAAALRVELRPTGVGTTVVTPGPVDTRMWDSVERSPEVAPALRRLRRMSMLPKASPEALARRTVAAVADGRLHVRTPRRLLPMYALDAAPQRIFEAMLSGVDIPLPAQAMVRPPDADSV